MNDRAPLLGAVIGSPVTHSLSPAIHEAAFRAAQRDGRYIAVTCEKDEVCEVVDRLRNEGVIGISVTMPLKEVIIDCLRGISDDARILRAVNCVALVDALASGHNTDGDGCCAALVNRGHAVLEGSTAVVLGAGGTARSVALALMRRGAGVVIVNRTASRAEQLVSELTEAVSSGAGSIAVGTQADLANASILVNATSVGMGSNETPVEPDLLHSGLVVLDAVYSPLDTVLLQSARASGARTVDGLWMLIEQARLQQQIWFGDVPDASVMRVAAERELASRQK